MQNYSYDIYAIIIKTASHKYSGGEFFLFFQKKKTFSLNSKYDENFIVLINKTLKWWMLMTPHLFRNIEKTHLNFFLRDFFFSLLFLLHPGAVFILFNLFEKYLIFHYSWTKGSVVYVPMCVFLITKYNTNIFEERG